MRNIRRAIIRAVLIRPVRRWLVARIRAAAADYVRANMIERPQAALQAALPAAIPARIALLTAQDAAMSAAVAETAAEVEAEQENRDVLRTLAIAAVVAAVVAGTALVIAAIVRSRREAEAKVGSEPMVVPVITPSRDDELRAINGIGPETAGRLRNAGVTSIHQIAAWSDGDIARIAEQIDTSVERIETEDWVDQAKVISSANEAASAASA